MGLFVSAFAKAWDYLAKLGTSGLGNNALTPAIIDTRALIARAANQLGHYIAVLVYVANQEQGAWKGSVGRAAGVGSDVAALADAQRQQWHHMLTQIMPASLRWLEDDIAKKHLGDLSKRLAKLEQEVKLLLKWREQVINWQGRVVNPTLKSYRDFASYFNGSPKATLDVWVRWFQHKDEFADWATPILVHTMIAYLAKPESKLLRDTLAGMIVDAWSDDANAVWQSLEKWLTSNT